ncbi:MAG TPA: M28 family peptidase, partial [Terriglobales bacterium]|nr:M28 family peptidase [Terriglobales bacterium]
KDMNDALQPIMAPLKQFGVEELKTDDVEWGTDHYDFLLEGVPTLVAEQAEANYLENYHATSDTFDKVDMAQLKKHVADMTVVVYGIANARERIGARLTHAQTDKILRDTHSDEQMKPLGIWAEWESGKRGRAK